MVWRGVDNRSGWLYAEEEGERSRVSLTWDGSHLRASASTEPHDACAALTTISPPAVWHAPGHTTRAKVARQGCVSAFEARLKLGKMELPSCSKEGPVHHAPILAQLRVRAVIN